MAKIFCVPQRQDGYVLGLVSLDTDKKPDNSTARFITTECDDDQGSEAALRALRALGLTPEYALPIHTGSAGEFYDMEVSIPRSVAQEKDSELIWIHPGHLAQGPDAAAAKEIFEFLGIRHEPPAIYQGRTNKDFVK